MLKILNKGWSLGQASYFSKRHLLDFPPVETVAGHGAAAVAVEEAACCCCLISLPTAWTALNSKDQRPLAGTGTPDDAAASFVGVDVETGLAGSGH